MARPRSLVLFASISLALAACGGETVSPDGGPGPVDAGGRDANRPDGGPIYVSPYDGSFRPDAGPIMPTDPGPCETWGIEEGPPITGLTAGDWTWVDFPEAHCMNGSETGIGINLSPTGDSHVVIYLEGGGACFDPVTCSGVANPSGVDALRFSGYTSTLDFYSIFRRDDDLNPLRDWNFVYVPYCTGDVHAGTNPEGYDDPGDDRGPLEQVGYLNVGHYLRRLVPTFPDASQVLLTGSSAGGFGALANYDQVAQAFGCTEVVLVDDSGPVMDDPYLRPCLQARTREYWQFHVPDDCPQCTAEDGGGFVALWGYLATKYPDRRFSLLSTTYDGTIRSFFSFGTSEGCDEIHSYPEDLFTEGLLDLRDRWIAPYPNVHNFYVEGSQHTFLPFGLRRPVADGVSPGEFLRRIVEDDPAWSNVGP